MAAKINWHIYGTNYVIDVKNVFYVFLFWSRFFTFFNVFFYFPNVFYLKKRWKSSELQAD